MLPQLRLETVTQPQLIPLPFSVVLPPPQPQDLEERPSHNRSQEKQCINIFLSQTPGLWGRSPDPKLAP